MGHEIIPGSSRRKADHPVEPLFVNRWSPRAMSGAPLAAGELQRLFEAARWAPSAYNNQPWRLLYAQRDTPHWAVFFDLLTANNQKWCAKAAALVLFVSKTTLDSNGGPCPTHSFDAGAAWENFALQGMAMDLAIHAMQGFDYAKARSVLAVPEGFHIDAMAAVGRPGTLGDLAAEYHEREFPKGRRPLAEIVCEGPFRF